MASQNTKKEDKPTKWERVYEDEESISIWKYDRTITTNGPVSVEYRWKRGFNIWTSPNKKKTIKDLIADEKKSKKKGI